MNPTFLILVHFHSHYHTVHVQKLHLRQPDENSLQKKNKNNLQDTQEERRSLESRLQAARTILRSQDEGLKHREEENRQVKSKLVERKPDSAT
ncbi:hypothetical protein GCK72_022981 [Caenorhabditis remanei]|uniref:Uncharacterized protein n=1 Tax=Caenorhabditis remanei TaxID=31234 RepID=A0A6A5FVI2_CAERE|nr:hypothetical protein GCK72_022981 [Caenorhabditis remanei]KAF1746525.1 hypothetical protein GCK72_022981 [Caenorhabditis remanei]